MKPRTSPWVKRAEARILPGASYDRRRPTMRDGESLAAIMRRTMPKGS